jgi:hypothetical protein
VLEHAIGKMLSHPLAEVRQIGLEIKRVAQAEVPTLVKYADAIPYLIETCQVFSCDSSETLTSEKTEHDQIDSDWCKLIDFDPEGEIKVLAAALFRFGGFSYTKSLETILSITPAERLHLAESLLGRMKEHDAPLRELEYTTYTFDLVLDQGGYAEFKRHRMMTQTPQTLTARLGYTVPYRFAQAGFEPRYRTAMEAAIQAYEELTALNPQVAAYIVPNGFNRRVLFNMNLREAFAFCQLRSSAQAHFSMRRVAGRVAQEIQRVHPLLAKYISLPEEPWQTVESQHFIQT